GGVQGCLVQWGGGDGGNLAGHSGAGGLLDVGVGGIACDGADLTEREVCGQLADLEDADGVRVAGRLDGVGHLLDRYPDVHQPGGAADPWRVPDQDRSADGQHVGV